MYAPVAGTASRSPRRGSGSSPVDQHVARLAVLARDRELAGGLLVRAVREQGRVAGAVELRPRVVRHAAVDRDVAAVARLLDRADAVERERGGADEGAARLDDQLWRASRLSSPSARDGRYDPAHELCDRRLGSSARVGPRSRRRRRSSPEPSPARRGSGRRTRPTVDGGQVRARIRELRADVHVQPFDLEAPTQGDADGIDRCLRPARTSSRGGRCGSARASRPRRLG